MQREALEQQTIIEYCDLMNYPIYAIPNGGRRDVKEAAYLKKSGVRAGVPDMCIPEARRGYHGLYIELKIGRNKATDSQKMWLDRLLRNGYFATVCYGSAQAIELLDWYFGGK